MPIIKYEPTFAELVDNAAQRRVEDVERWNKTMYLITGNGVTFNPLVLFLNKFSSGVTPNPQQQQQQQQQQQPQPNQDIPTKIQPTLFLKISAYAYLFVNGPFTHIRSIVIGFMLLTLIFRLSDPHLQEETADVCYYLDTLINIFFIIEGFLRLLTLPATFVSRKHSTEQIRSLTYELLRCGWIEIILSICSLILIQKLNSSNAICWINYFRMTFVAKFFLSESPQVEVILSGIMSGLRSVISTWFLLMVCFVVYGVLTTSFFRANDPAHFSTVGSSIFTLFRISTMDDWSIVLYINAYGCDAVPSEYIVIPKNSTEPRYIDVFSGRMYLYLCDSPAAFPYAASLIFISFTVMTGFILISLTVAAVSAGVKRRLQEIQTYNEEKKLQALEKQQAAIAMDILEKLKSDSEEYHNSSSIESSVTLTKEPEPEVVMPSKLRPVIDKSLSLLRALTLMKSSNQIVPNEEQERERESKLKGKEKEKEKRLKKAKSSFKGIPLIQNKPLIRQICKQMWNDVDTTKKKRKELREELEKEGLIEGLEGQEGGEIGPDGRRVSVLSPGGHEKRGSVLGIDIGRRGSVMGGGGGAGAGGRRGSVAGGRRGSVNTPRRKSSLKAVAQALQFTQQSLSILNTNGKKDMKGGKKTLTMGSSNSLISSTSLRGNRQQSFYVLLKEYNLEEILSSTENILLFIRNSLASPIYIGYLISLIITTAGCQIYCVNKDNCSFFWPVFLLIQILLTMDILIRIVTAYPTYFDYFDNQRNIFDCFIVCIIWIPIFYTGYGVEIAGTARIVYLLRLFPLLSWITDLQVLFLAISSSIRPLFYVICIMFIMFFQFAVAGVLIFKKNDEFYFGTLYRAMNTLFQLCTLDTWGTVALKNMYGCDYYGSDTGVPDVDEMCLHPVGLGWFAAWYFIIFITLSMMILHSLFVGIIISARELLKDSVFKEAKMWKLVYLRVKKYGLQNSTLMNLLEVYNACDTEKNGLLSKKELSVILKYLPSINFNAVIKQIGVDSRGQLNFAEFIDLIHFIGVYGKVYKHSHPQTTLDLKTLRASQPKLDADGNEIKEEGNNTSNLISGGGGGGGGGIGGGTTISGHKSSPIQYPSSSSASSLGGGPVGYKSYSDVLEMSKEDD